MAFPEQPDSYRRRTHRTWSKRLGGGHDAMKRAMDDALEEMKRTLMRTDTLNIKAWGESHNTAEEVAEAIAYIVLCEGIRDYHVYLSRMEDIWKDPTQEMVIAVWERATSNGAVDDTFMQWGEMTLAQMMADFDV